MNRLFVLIIVLFGFHVTSAQPIDSTGTEFPKISGSYLGQEPPGPEPVLFAPGILPVDGVQHCVPAFSPDGKELYWLKMNMDGERPRGEIWFMKESGGRWTPPQIAPFSGEYNDHSPVFSHDYMRLYFASSRPGNIGQRRNIWYVRRTDNGWSEPVNLGSPPNTEIGASQPTFCLDGTLYFAGSYAGAQWNSGIYRSRFAEGSYLEPEPLPVSINTEHADIYPYIAPDESYLLFGSSRPGGNSTETDLYITFRLVDDRWGDPIHLDSVINNGHTVSFSCVSHDGRYLFFNRFDDDNDKFYWVDARILDQYRPAGR